MFPSFSNNSASPVPRPCFQCWGPCTLKANSYSWATPPVPMLYFLILHFSGIYVWFLFSLPFFIPLSTYLSLYLLICHIDHSSIYPPTHIHPPTHLSNLSTHPSILSIPSILLPAFYTDIHSSTHLPTYSTICPPRQPSTNHPSIPSIQVSSHSYERLSLTILNVLQFLVWPQADWVDVLGRAYGGFNYLMFSI